MGLSEVLLWRRVKLSLSVAVPRIAKALILLMKQSSTRNKLDSIGPQARGQLYADIVDGKFKTNCLDNYVSICSPTMSEVTLVSAMNVLHGIIGQISELKSKLEIIRVGQVECMQELKLHRGGNWDVG